MLWHAILAAPAGRALLPVGGSDCGFPANTSRFAGARAADERAEDDEVHMRDLDAHECRKARQFLVAEKTKAARPAKIKFTLEV